MITIIVLIIIYSINSSRFSCDSEEDYSKCQTHDVGIADFSCFKIRNKEVDPEDSELCSAFPEKAEDQKFFWRVHRGMLKEMYSSSIIYDPKMITTGEKDFFQKGEEVTLKSVSLSSEDLKKIKNHKTCSYQLFGRYYDNIKKYPSGYPSITDKTLCFNAETFSDLDDLVNCGFAKISYTIDGKIYNIDSCLYSIDDNMSDSMKEYYHKYYEGLFDEDEGLIYLLAEFGEETEDSEDYDFDLDIDYKKKQDKKRRLEEGSIKKYEITIEDKYGKITKVSSDSGKTEVIEKGNKPKSSSSRPIYQGNNTTNLKINIILLLFFIFLNL